MTDEERRQKHAAEMREFRRKHPHYNADHPEWQQRSREKHHEKYLERSRHDNKLAYQRHREDRKARAKAWKEANPERHRKTQRLWHLRKLAERIGLTPDEFAVLVVRIDSGPCELCGAVGPVMFDHCHDTNTFRGLLCKRCNTGIGVIGDTVEHVARALDYLKRGRPVIDAASLPQE